MCLFCRAEEQQIRDYGKIFGYPQCCIDEFVRDTAFMNETGIDPRTEDQKDIGSFTFGFVPCKKHTQMIMNGQVELDDIIIDRDAEKSAELNMLAEEEHNQNSLI